MSLINKKVFDKLYRDEYGVLYPSVKNSSEVDEMNKDCIRFDSKYGAGKIVGGKDELHRIAEKLYEPALSNSIDVIRTSNFEQSNWTD